jgi:hypothetical protein
LLGDKKKKRRRERGRRVVRFMEDQTRRTNGRVQRRIKEAAEDDGKF